MHIPDGYLSPQTYIPLYGVSFIFWKMALDKIKKNFTLKNVPYIGMSSAVSFLIMMFNVPIPGGGSGHAVGSAAIALILGPWSAVISVSCALIIQAFVFGDGGITAIGANCFNMAVLMPFAGWFVFKFLKKLRLNDNFSAFISGYISLNIAALATAVQFGIQPIIASEAGKALYSPYPISLAVSAMAAEHLLLFGFIEGAVTAGIIAYFRKTEVLKTSFKEI